MEIFRYRVTLDVEVEAFDESDAEDAILDELGVGEQAGIKVTSCEVKIRRGNRK